MTVYSTGTVTVTNGSTTVEGAGTAWFGTLQAGYMFIGPDGRTISIANVVDNDTLTLGRAYQGSSAADQEYEAFPTQSLAGTLAAQLLAINAEYQSLIDTVGQGRFPNGTAAAPPISFTADTDTGLRRVASNQGALVAGGNDVLTFASSGLGGTGVQTDGADAADKVLKSGAASLLLNDEDALTLQQASGSVDANALRKSGFWRYGSNDLNVPSSAGMLLHLCRLSGVASIGRHIQFAFAHTGEVYTRAMNDSSGGWSAWDQSLQRSDLLGTVSESSGAATGAIIEAGSNANGDYTRFADGTQICRIRDYVAAQTSADALTYTWTFPAAFSENDGLAVVASRASAAGAHTNVGRDDISDTVVAIPASPFSSVDIIMRAVSGVSFDPAATVNNNAALAIGRWF